MDFSQTLSVCSVRFANSAVTSPSVQRLEIVQNYYALYIFMIYCTFIFIIAFTHNYLDFPGGYLCPAIVLTLELRRLTIYYTYFK